MNKINILTNQSTLIQYAVLFPLSAWTKLYRSARTERHVFPRTLLSLS